MLIPLKRFNDDRLKMIEHENAYPKHNGLECPECKSELQDIDSMLLLSNPPQLKVCCSECDFKGYRYE